MEKHFKIDQTSTTFIKRPSISYKVREYFEDIIHTNLLTPKKLILNSKWEIHLVLCFVEEGPRYKSDYLFMSKIPKTLSKECIKKYEILIPLKLLNNIANPHLKTIELIFEALSIFFTSNYKTVKTKDMEEIWKIVDIKYLLSLPYPSTLEEQKYSSDVVDENGKVIDILASFIQVQ